MTIEKLIHELQMIAARKPGIEVVVFTEETALAPAYHSTPEPFVSKSYLTNREVVYL